MVLNIYSDGGARGNPGPAAAAFVATNEKGEKIFDYGHYLGESTNNIAEYSALYMAMKWLRKYASKEKVTSVVFHLDSELVVKQLNGIYKIKNANLKNLYDRIQTVKEGYDFAVKFVHVPRAQNKHADKLVNETLDNVA
jgi:ribonuclease HI